MFGHWKTQNRRNFKREIMIYKTIVHALVADSVLLFFRRG